MKKGSTWFLRAVVVTMGLVGVAVCSVAVMYWGKGIVAEFPSLPSYWQYLVGAGFCLVTIPFLGVLYQTIKLLRYIDKNNAFSEQSVTALKRIKYLAISMTLLLWAFFMPLAFLVAQIDDAPGVVPISGTFFAIPLVIGVFAAVLERLLRNAIDMKSENELTV